MTARPLVFATRNRGKLVELRELLPGIDGALGRRSRAASSAARSPTSSRTPTRSPATRRKKAREVSRVTGLPALADDSGLEVDALGGAPGVYSARYAGDGSTTTPRTTRSCSPRSPTCRAAQRTARFRAVLALADVAGPLGDEVLTADGACEGMILDAPRGTGGFGYDPLFFSPELGQTFAEAGIGPKSELSHRARAMQAMKPQILDYLRQLGE